MSKLFIDIGSTYFKVAQNGKIDQYFRDFNKNIFDDLNSKCSDMVSQYAKEDIHICSSANGGLSTLIIGLTNSFSLKYTINTAFNSGINIIDTVLYPKIESEVAPSEMIDVVIVVGGIDSVENVFDEKLLNYLEKVNYQNIVYVGSTKNAAFLEKNLENIVVPISFRDTDGNVLEERSAPTLMRYAAVGATIPAVVFLENIPVMYKSATVSLFSALIVETSTSPYLTVSVKEETRTLNGAEATISGRIRVEAEQEKDRADIWIGAAAFDVDGSLVGIRRLDSSVTTNEMFNFNITIYSSAGSITRVVLYTEAY